MAEFAERTRIPLKAGFLEAVIVILVTSKAHRALVQVETEVTVGGVAASTWAALFFPASRSGARGVAVGGRSRTAEKDTVEIVDFVAALGSICSVALDAFRFEIAWVAKPTDSAKLVVVAAGDSVTANPVVAIRDAWNVTWVTVIAVRVELEGFLTDTIYQLVGVTTLCIIK